MIFGVMRLVNFAHGSYIIVCTFILLAPAGEGVARLFLGVLPGVLLVPAVMLTGIAMAMLSEIVLFRRLRGSDPTTMLVASFAAAAGLQNALLMLYGSRPIAVELWPELTRPVQVSGLVVPALQIVIIAVTAVSLVALTLFLRLTRFGIAMRASSENFRMARMLGVPANSIILAAFAISGSLAALTSLLMVPQTGLADLRMADNILLIAFVATVVGGLGNLTGAVLSAYLIGIVAVFLQTLLPLEIRPYRDAFVFLIVIAVLMLRPRGLFSFGPSRERV
jgi:branched-chain amino acid transport system permease protein